MKKVKKEWLMENDPAQFLLAEYGCSRLGRELPLVELGVVPRIILPHNLFQDLPRKLTK